MNDDDDEIVENDDEDDDESDDNNDEEEDEEFTGDVSFNMTGKEDPNFSPDIDSIKKAIKALSLSDDPQGNNNYS